jgi:thiamine-phosphate pyrophosphorylase
VGVLQYRDKTGSPAEILHCAAAISEAFAGSDCLLILNDRPDLALLAGWNGVHVGHKDITVCAARKVLDRAPAVPHSCAEDAREWATRTIVGTSTHNDEQVIAADAGCADYVAVGPVFATSTKADAEPVVGLDGIRRARALTRKPMVAIGGITLENARSVIDAGADSVAVIGGLFVKGTLPSKVAEDFLAILR